MQTTGSRVKLQFPPGVLRLLVGATIVFVAIAMFAVSNGTILGKAQAGAEAKATVNSRGNTSDGDCEGPPNDNVVGGDCTLREAILDANNGLVDLINFHPAVFPIANPGVINIDDDTDGEGCLPPITRDGVTIDSENAGVIIDGDEDEDLDLISPITCDAAIHFSATENGFDGTVMGGGNLVIRDFDADGIRFDGNDVDCSVAGSGCGMGDITVDGVVIYNVSEDGVDIEDTREARKVHIMHNDIVASYPLLFKPDLSDADEAVDIDVDKCFDPDVPHGCIFENDQTVLINDNIQLVGDHKGVAVDFYGDIGNPDTGNIATVTVQVNGNDYITALPSSDPAEGVDLRFSGCITKSSVIFNVDDNTRINSFDDDAVDLNVDAGYHDVGDCWILGSLNPEFSTTTNNGSNHATVELTVNDNGDIRVQDEEHGDGVSTDIALCCGEAPKGSVQHKVSVSVNGNGNIVGDGNGVLIQSDVCCGDDSTSTVDVSSNGEISGRNDDAVEVDNYVGETREVSDEKGCDDSDGNIGETTINDNDRLTGNDGQDGVDVDQQVGVAFCEDKGSGDDNTSNVTINGNARIDGDSDGVDVYSFAGSCMGEADGNLATITLMDNAQIDGNDSDGADLNADSGSTSFQDYCDGEGTRINEGDDNVATILVQGNDRFVGGDGSGVDVEIFAGGDTKGSERNTTNLTVTENGDIEGEGTEDFDDGVRVEEFVCCSSRKSNFANTTITDNTKIIGHNGDGIDIHDACCSTAKYVTLIDGNERITGGGDDGIEYTVELGDDDPGDEYYPEVGLSEDLKQDGFFNTTSNLTISNNLIQDSNEDGIYICCGPFEEDEQDVKSVIRDNVITTNLDHGIEIDSAFGLNIGPNNEIFKNGDNSALDAGIEIDNQSSVFELAENGEFCCLRVVPANHNRITDNSIYDNRGLGIDLVTDVDQDGDNETDHGVGCPPKSDPINPNDCIDFPVFKTQAGDKLLGTACSLCTVEIFMADNDPADQADHGEGIGSDVVADHNYLATGQADADGNWSIQLPCGLGAMDLTATATDKVKNTSEFAANISTLGTSACGTATSVPTTPAPTNTPGQPTNTPVPPTATSVPPTATSVPPTPTTTSKACGDVNDNGSVDAVDAQLILQYKAGLIPTLPNLPSADVNDSGEVTSVDAALVLQVEAGLIPLGTLHCPG